MSLSARIVERIFARFETGASTLALSRPCSGVAGRFLGELHAGGQPELGVDVGEVGLHGAR